MARRIRLTPLAVAAAILLAVFVVRRSSVTFDGAAAGPARPASAPAAQSNTLIVLTPGSAGTGDHAQALAVRPRSGVAAPASAPEPNDVASIAVVSIDVAPLAVDALTPDPIPIERLDAIVPITVAPLEITDTQRRHE